MVEVITVDVLQKNYCLRLSDLDAIIITGSCKIKTDFNVYSTNVLTAASVNDEKL